MIGVFTAITWLLTMTVFVATLLPLTHSVRWWVRVWEFPRLHIAVLGIFCVILVSVMPISFKVALIIGLCVCIFYQATRIFPYTRFAPTEIEMMTDVPASKRIKLLSANVLLENTRKADLTAIIKREDPDILFLMETDQAWLNAIKDCLAGYTTVVTHPLDNYYGLIFATRLKTRRADVIFLSEDNTPTLRAELIAPDGTGFNFVGLHPRPPVPGNDTALRDQQIKTAAKLAGKAEWPTICMGDFNDVAWSWTSRRFKKYGGFLEPRVGRGMFPTFHAQYPILGVPIDQLYITAGIGLVSFGRLEDFGSDHYPISAEITFDGIKPTNSTKS